MSDPLSAPPSGAASTHTRRFRRSHPVGPYFSRVEQLRRKYLPRCPNPGYVNWYGANTWFEQYRVAREFSSEYQRTSELPLIRAYWYRVRSAHDQHLDIDENGEAASRACCGEYRPSSPLASVAVDPPLLNDNELACELLEAARRVSLTAADSDESN